MFRGSVLVLLLSQAAAAHALQPLRIADEVYAFVGELGEVTADNGGDVGNSGFIVGSDGVIVVDTGPSYRHGTQMLRAIRQVTPKPVKLVINTHAVQEFLFGNAAFADAGVPLLTHRKSAELMHQRCERCLQNLRSTLGEPAMTATRLVVPDRVIDTSSTLEVAGTSIELLHFGWGSTPGDLAVFHPRSGVVFAGGLVSNRQIPQLRDGDFGGWLAALAKLRELPVQTVVPGHGTPGGIQLIEDTAAYLRALDGLVQRMYKSGASLTHAVDNAALPAFSSWALYATLHRQNTLHRYLQLEIEELGGSR